MQQATITGFYTAIFALFYIYLGLRVVYYRRAYQQDIGAGDHPKLARAIRTHANASEYVPITLILLLCYELIGGPNLIVHSLGLAFLVARLLHFIGFGFHIGVSFGRVFGTVLNYLVIITLAILCLWGFIQMNGLISL